MKICDKCGHRNFKLEPIKKPECSECGEKLPEHGTIHPNGHDLGYARNEDGELIGNCGYTVGEVQTTI